MDDVPETLRILFAGGAEPIHCRLRTTCRSEVVCIATRMYCGRLVIMDLDHVHHSSMERYQKDKYLKHRTLQTAFQVLALRLAKIWR